MSARTSPRASVEPELVALRKLGEDLAQSHARKMTTGHLLAAIASQPSLACELLRERRLDAELLLKAARILEDDQADAIARAVQRAREFAGRALKSEPGALHLLFALCGEKSTAAHRALVQCGADVTRIRTSAMQLAMGIAPPPRKAPKAHASSTQVELRPSAPPKPLVQKGSIEKKKSKVELVLDPKKHALALGRNLTEAAARGELEPAVAREEIVERTLDVLAKHRANCPILVGPAGVGKTSVVRAIAARAASERVIIEIEPSALLAGTAARGSLAERIAQLKSEVAAFEGRVVVFFDDIHTLLCDGDEARAELKSALARGELPCIGATTPEDLKRAFDQDPGLARRFTLIDVVEPSPEEARSLIAAVTPSLEKHHGVRIPEEVIELGVEWSVRYVPSRALPDKAVSVLDLAGARAKRRGLPETTPELVAEVIAESAQVPIERLLEADAERYLRLESLLGERVVGHEPAIARIAAVLRRNASGFRYRRPIGSFLLLGPTGVGKTETAKAIAECLFYSEHAMTRLDMSEYAEPHAIARLVGAPPGYVGHEAGGQLTEAVRRRPYQVILLDEIEKAHRDVLETFLQVFDEGRLTDGRGRTVDLTETVILLTSNLGADAVQTRGRAGFGQREPAKESREGAMLAAARAALPPELYNRLDEVLVYAPLGREDVAEVARRMIAALASELARARGVHLEVSERATLALLDLGGFDPELGARPMRRAIGRHLETPIAEMLLRGEVRRGDVVTVDVEDGAIVVDAVTPTPGSRVSVA